MTSRGQGLITGLQIPGYGEDEVLFMEETLVLTQPEFIGEWGTNRGSSARIWIELSKLHNIRCEIHTVELPVELAPLDPAHPGDATGFFIEGMGIRQHLGDGVTEGLLAWVKSGRKKALFFLDGDHMVAGVFREIALIYRIAPQATLLLHDSRHGPGAAAVEFLVSFPEAYSREDCSSQEGMMRLTPK